MFGGVRVRLGERHSHIEKREKKRLHKLFFDVCVCVGGCVTSRSRSWSGSEMLRDEAPPPKSE